MWRKESSMRAPRIIVAGVHSGVGKTTISLGLMAALRLQGLKVQAFKVGPDFIDPGLHFHASGSRSHNLDSWMGSAEVVRQVFARNAEPADISIIEGVMGLYDGARGEKIKGSTADIAEILKTPVILVVNVSGMAQSCVALVKGYCDYHPNLKIKGVILNQAADFHKTWVKPSLEEELGLQVLGCIPREEAMKMPERHLGLLPAEENEHLEQAIQKMAEIIDGYIDLQGLMRIAETAPNLDITYSMPEKQGQLTIGVARDAAFSFYYQDNLDLLQETGAKLVFFSPMKDADLPKVDGLYIGGGFPEMFLDTLNGNHSMLAAIRQAHADSMPIFAECGGYMYLTRRIHDWSGNSWTGVGIVPAEIRMTRKLQALGYVEATALGDSILAGTGDVLRAHEFHYSTIEGLSPEQSALILTGGRRMEERTDGYAGGGLFASYLHLHLRSNPLVACHFLNACQAYHDSLRASSEGAGLSPGMDRVETVKRRWDS
ncbi:MAG TPA: cobyrinate a,c-diamide synthase [Syntrophomonadaceae bacterium]|nr:cobyrinate a,c-diamide synthase [Syntrophomonadaceae bacterium]